MPLKKDSTVHIKNWRSANKGQMERKVSVIKKLKDKIIKKND